MSKQVKRVIAIVLALIISLFISNKDNLLEINETSNTIEKTVNTDNAQLQHIFRTKQSGKMITIKAKVVKVLADDLIGDKHQKMILEVLNSNVSLLLAHNIDIAPRIPIIEGDQILVHGQYEWSKKGGVIHWTHRDINNEHPNGWVEYKQNRYQ